MRLIDADALMEKLNAHNRGGKYKAEEIRALDAIAAYVEKRVAELPEAGPIPARRGRWGRWMYEGDLFYRCTECGKLVRIIGRSPYCPNCGANMQGTGTEPERSRVYGERRREYGDGTESDEGHDPEPRADIGGDGNGASGGV